MADLNADAAASMLVLAAGESRARALSIHLPPAAVMIAGALPLML